MSTISLESLFFFEIHLARKAETSVESSLGRIDSSLFKTLHLGVGCGHSGV